MMSLINALLETYDFALQNNLVDNPKLSLDGLTLLPVYHSSKRSVGEDIFEITVDKDSNSISGRFLEKDEIIIFPITEDSITRSGAKVAPHAISDELSYLARTIDGAKNKEYLDIVEDLLEYEKNNTCEDFRILGKYIIKNTILEDFLRFHFGSKEYHIDDKFKLSYEEIDDKGKIKKKLLDLKKIFITFKIEKEFKADISLTKDKIIHNFYISYVRNKNAESENITFCDVTGKLEYCTERHRGLMGTAKLISISNNDETYYGRFKHGKDIYRIGYETSQKIHNMLKYLIENNSYSRFIGEGAYIINWLSQDLKKGGIELLSSMDNEDFEDYEEQSMDDLGGEISRKLGRYFLGEDETYVGKRDFYVLIIEKISNGRISVKYFRRLSRSEAYERTREWYVSTNWKFYDHILKKNIYKSPRLDQIVDFIYGQENNKGFLNCENKKLKRSAIERLIPCIIDSQRLPKDICNTTFYKLSKKQSYKKSWNIALNIGCSLIKKHKNDYENYIIDPDKISEVKELEESRSFYYGKLMAIYEKIELDAIRGRSEEMSSQKSKDKSQRITNADRLWSSMIRTPERTRFILESKVKPYMNMLKKTQPGLYVFYDKLITGITLKFVEFKEGDREGSISLNEDFILGYYYQKNDFYQKKDKDGKKKDE